MGAPVGSNIGGQLAITQRGKVSTWYLHARDPAKPGHQSGGRRARLPDRWLVEGPGGSQVVFNFRGLHSFWPIFGLEVELVELN